MSGKVLEGLQAEMDARNKPFIKKLIEEGFVQVRTCGEPGCLMRHATGPDGHPDTWPQCCKDRR